MPRRPPSTGPVTVGAFPMARECGRAGRARSTRRRTPPPSDTIAGVDRRFLCEAGPMRNRALVLLRHGRSRADDEGVHEGRYDSPLTAVGRDQATRLAQHWREAGTHFDRIVCSSLVRARETA